MGDDVLPEPGSPFGRRVRQRLRDEQVIWLTTIGNDGTPQPNPVWFLWEDPATVLTYNRATAHRLTHIELRPRVSLHLDNDGHGGDVVVLTGPARRALHHPAPHENPEYLAKYRDAMTRVSGSPEEFSAGYPAPVEIEVTRVRGF